MESKDKEKSDLMKELYCNFGNGEEKGNFLFGFVDQSVDCSDQFALSEDRWVTELTLSKGGPSRRRGW